ncbi:MAG: protein translocase subunit SecDF, partial [Alphaproteobacteria bacterium]|nr:protein translocase subunit SecDF [Alphaproteobacteria bacterium]
MRTSAWRLIVYVLIVLAGAATALPNLLTPQQLTLVPDWLPKQQLALGLDLRGGAHLMLEVDAKALVNERLQDLTRDARRVLREAKIGTQAVRRDGNALIVALNEAGKSKEAIRVLTGAAASHTDALGQTSSEIDVAETSPTELRVTLSSSGVNARVTAAAEQSLEIIRLRIDETGLAEPTLQRVGSDR